MFIDTITPFRSRRSITAVHTPVLARHSLRGSMSGMRTLVPAKDWMEWFLGSSERDLLVDRSAFLAPCGTKLLNRKTGQQWPMGEFEFPSVAELQSRVDALPPKVADDDESSLRSNACGITIMDNTDIGVLQGMLDSKDRAMVQIASNFHCLENGSVRAAADHGRLVEGYALDCTQGPAASFGVPAASLLRAHFPFMGFGSNKETSPEKWGQTSDRQLRLLSDVEQFCGECKNGKLLFTGEERGIDSEADIEMVAKQIRVGVHSDAQVVFRRGPDPLTLEVIPEEPYPLIDQVLSASANWRNLGVTPSQKHLENVTRALLRASYEGAYLSAIVRKRRNLYLTLIGGASFGNPMDLILDELVRAHKRWAAHPASELIEVHLVLYQKGVASSYQELCDLGKRGEEARERLSRSRRRENADEGRCVVF
eukprot:TRINITY_DN21800_c0_g1_i1.p1 TRINITY_DN21800_c0_g1~~TRINITY_DN21800_c0_g1_i1.p1  ORF type:complete len:425 (+),score=53.69 TRINITY_DN21800_c0_g1_i1:11-1285(+)